MKAALGPAPFGPGASGGENLPKSSEPTSRIERIAVLNRGEPARRCLRAIRELRAEEGSSLVGIALFTDPDQRSTYVREADERLSLGAALRRSNGGDLRPAYLDHPS